MRILFMDVDTLRPDHMGCYGYYRNTTPNLDALCQEGMRFDNYYCSDAPCLPSRAALVTGMFGIRNGAVGHGGTAADRRLTGPNRGFGDYINDNNMHNVMRKAGMFTASISTFPERHSSYWFSAGFNETYNVGGHGNESGERILPVALDWLDRHGADDNWFLHVHLWDPHTPYRTPADWPNYFEDSPVDSWLTEDIYNEHKKMSSPHGVNEIGMFTDEENPKFPKHPGAIRKYSELRRMFDGYDGGVRYADMLLGKIMDKMRDMGIYDDAVIILTSDHGENLGELGLYAEHATADNVTCRIPMIVKWPGCARGVDSEFHYSLDLAPTLCDMLGVKPSKWWDGQSYADTLRTGEKQGRDYLVVSQMAHVCQRSARFGDYIYMRTIHDGFHLFDREMLFNVKTDPHEVHNIAKDRPDLCAQGARMILEWQEDQMKKSDTDVDPMWTVMRENGPYHIWGELDGYLDRLEKTGRHEAAVKLRAEYKKDDK